MTPHQFIEEMVFYYGEDIPDAVMGKWLRYLSKFNDFQLRKIQDEVFKKCKRLPKIAHINEAAAELDFLHKPKKPTGYQWEPTNCRLCRGEGRILVRMLVLFEYTEDGRQKTVRKLRNIGPYSSADHLDWDYETGCYDFLYRCSCAAGERPGLSEKIPRWRSSFTDFQTVAREQEDSEDRKDFRAVGEFDPDAVPF